MAVPRAALRADLALTGIVLVWGSTFVIVQRALADVSTLLFLALRFTLAAVVLALAFRGIVWTRARVIAGVLCGVNLFMGFLLQTAGLRHTTPSKSAFITGLSVVIVPLLAAIVNRRPPRVVVVAGVTLATIGMALMTLDFGSLTMGYGDALTLACALAFGVHILLVAHYVPRAGYQPLAVMQIATVALLSTGSFWWAEPFEVHWTPELAGAVLVTALLATALAFSVMAWAQQHTSAAHVALIFSLEPVFAAVASFVFLGEVLTAIGFLGSAMILAGVLAVELKPN